MFLNNLIISMSKFKHLNYWHNEKTNFIYRGFVSM
jgi:hypothetical protein